MKAAYARINAGIRSRGFIRFSCALALLAAFLAPRDTAAGPTFDPEAGLPFVRNFPPELYRAHSQIFASVEAPDGIMYFATYGAVVSFDGERWRQFPVPGTWLRALVIGPDGLVYVGGGNTLGRLEPAPETGLLHFVSLIPLIPAAHREFGTVWSAARLEPDATAFGIDGALLIWRNGAFSVTPHPDARPSLRPAGPRVFCHSGERLLEWRAGAWYPFLNDARLATARRITVLPAGPDQIRIALDQGTLLQSVRTTSGVTLEEWNTPGRSFLQKAGIRNGVQLADGSYALSTAGEGVVILAADGTPLRRLTAATGLAHDATYGLATSTDGALWVETANGLSRVEPNAAWTLFDARNGRPDSLASAPIRLSGRLLMNLSDRPPVRLRPAADGLDLARLEPVASGLPTRLANFVSAHGHLYNAGERSLLRVADPSKVLYQTTSPVEHILSWSKRPGVIVMGQLRGVQWVNVDPDDTVTLLGQAPDFDQEITNIIELSDGTLWLGTTAGIALRLRLEADGRLRDAVPFDASRGLPNNAGWVKVESTPEGVLVCVREGVFRLDANSDRLVPHAGFAQHWPAGINTLPITTDRAGRFWFQTAHADGYQLGCLDLRSGTPVWTSLGGAMTEPLGFGAARALIYLREADQEILWISGTRASVRLDLGKASTQPPAPPVVLTAFSQGDRHWAPRLQGSERFAFDREPLRLSFASPGAVAGGVTYETRLLGYARNWTPATHPEVSYTNLSGGPFTLEVRARDALNRPGPTSRVSFSVAPPWHRSPSAYALYGLAGCTGLFGFYRWRLGRAEREQRRLEALVNTRTLELASARDQAETASRAKSAFLASMSHELRTPLNGVIGYAQVLQGDVRLLPDQQERLGIVRSSGEHLLRMINDVLDLAKIEAGKLELRLAPCALPDLLREVVAAHAPAAASKGLTLTLDVASDLPPWVEADAQKLRQVLDNLVGNAIKFTKNGRVTVQAHPAAPGAGSLPDEPRRIMFAVTDTGPGIAPADQRRLFQPFEQLSESPPNATGTGLGLAIARALVERMGGSLALTSSPGAGSTFSWHAALRVVPGNQLRTTERPPATGYIGPRRHLVIVDDHPVNRSLLVDLLEPLGFECRAYESGADALRAAGEPDLPWPDLLILDVRMEGLDGLELTRRFRALSANRPLRILLTSASVLTFDPAEGRAAGCDDFLPKPFRTTDLVDKIGRLLALQWIVEPSPNSQRPPIPAAAAAIPEPIRESLRELLASGDLEALRSAVAQERALHPEAEIRWRELDDAAAGFQLSRLRQLLDLP